jgi:excisionase family DNA binding protein
MVGRADDLLTTEQVAAELGITRRRVQVLITTRRLPAQQIGHAFVVRRGDIDQVRHRPVGRPRTRPA